MEEQPGKSPSGTVHTHDPILQQIPNNLPNSTTILVLGILSIAFCWWHVISFVGIVLGVVTLVLSRKALVLYSTHPKRFSVSSLNNVKAGRICAIIGLTISLIVFLFVILIFVGILATIPFWGMMNQ